MFFKQLFDKKLAQYSYLIGCQAEGAAIVVDPMRDIDRYYELAAEENLEITAATDTHIHADYVTGLREFAEREVKIYASDEGDKDWKYEWLLNSEYNYQLMTEGDSISIGNIQLNVIHTPGHTPESISFLVTDRATTDQPMGILSGDFVFVGDVGRPDLLETAAGHKGAMKPAAQELYKSVKRFEKLPEYLQVWAAHGSGSACGKALGAIPETTVGYETRFSPAFKSATSENEFVDFILDGQPEPPLYFGRMKKVNKEGPQVLGGLPQPAHLAVNELIGRDGIILDAREKYEFIAGHIPGSLLTTYDNNFNTIAGSYADAESDLYLVIQKSNLEGALRDLVRVGLDNIKGFVTPQELDNWNGDLTSVEAIDFDDLEENRKKEEVALLDVRKATEFAESSIPNALNIAHTRLAGRLDELPKDKEWLVHCASGQRASYAVGLLIRYGFNVQWVDDKFDNWEQKYGKSKRAPIAK